MVHRKFCNGQSTTENCYVNPLHNWLHSTAAGRVCRAAARRRSRRSDRHAAAEHRAAGWAKRDDLAFLLREGFGIAYEHVQPFAPTAELLDGYRAGGDWDAYALAYRALLSQRDAATVGRDLFARYLIVVIASCLQSISPID